MRETPEADYLFACFGELLASHVYNEIIQFDKIHNNNE